MGWMAAGAGIDAIAGRRDNMFNKKEADRARDWSKEMANTEMQRRVQDLLKAGLNPMLAITEGAASTPGSAQANAGSRGTNFAGAFHSAQALKLAKERNDADVANIEAATAKTAAETELIRAEIPYSGKNAFFKNEILYSQMKELNSKVSSAQSEAEVKALMPEFQRFLNKAQELDMSRRQAEDEFFKQIGEGSKWAPLIRDLIIGYRHLQSR